MIFEMDYNYYMKKRKEKDGFILALDQGTTSSRAILFNLAGEMAGLSQKELTQIYPKPGWVEQDPADIWNDQYSVASKVITGNNISPDQIISAGITNQRETTVVWDKKSGKPVYNAIVWQDRRTADYCSGLKKEGIEKTITDKTGLLADPYFSATKVAWILDNVPGARRKAEKGELLFGTVDSWLIWNLSGGGVHATDVTNASRTLLYNIHTLTWDDDLLKLFNIPSSMLPDVRSCAADFCSTTHLPGGLITKITGVAGDQQSALFGQQCITPGMVKNTYGTGCFMVMNTGDKPVRSGNRLLSTIAWELNGHATYALEGSVFTGGAIIQWLRDGLGLIKTAGESEKMALTVPDNGGIYFVPALTGLGAPYWDPEARGLISGITRGTTSGHLARAALESIALQSFDILKAMEGDTGIPINCLRVDGGASENNLLMQFQADILGIDVIRPVVMETTALGAAYFSGLGAGIWKDATELNDQWKEERRFKPSGKEEEVKKTLEGWHNTVRRSTNS